MLRPHPVSGRQQASAVEVEDRLGLGLIAGLGVVSAEHQHVRNAQGHRAQEIRAAIEKLSPKQQAAVLMHKYQGMDYAEIAQALDCSIPALKSLLFRAYQTLRQRLAHFARARVA